MTAAKIRKDSEDAIDAIVNATNGDSVAINAGLLTLLAHGVSEVAAQLAELNEILRTKKQEGV